MDGLEDEKQWPKCQCHESGTSKLRTMSEHFPGSDTFSKCHHRSWSKWTMSVIVVLLLFISGVNCQGEIGKNGTQSTQGDGSSSSSSRATPRAIDKAMDPLYIMTSGFLNLIQPVNSGFILDEADLLDEINDGNFEVILMSLEDWQMWVTHYLGFVICGVFGLLFALVMPIAGCCVCCCRLCGRCGGKSSLEEKKGDRCRRGTCGFLLALFTLIVLAGMVCGFVTNELLREQTTTDEQRAVLNSVNTELQSLDNFKDNTVLSFKSAIIGSLEDTADDVIGTIQSAANSAKDSLGEMTESVDMLDEALELAEATQTINSTMTTVRDTTGLLVSRRRALQTELSAVRDDILDSLVECGNAHSICQSLRGRVATLETTGDYTQVDDVSDELTKVQDVLGNNLVDLIKQGQSEYEDIENMVQNDIQTELNKAEDEVDNIKTEVTKEIDTIIKDLEEFQFNSTRSSIRDLQPGLDEYGTYRYYAGIGLCCLILLIVLFALLGLCFGCCGGAAGDDAGTCNRSVGATILMVGVAFSFLFAWVVMVIVLVIFLGGGLAYTEVCRYAVDIPNAPQPVKNTIDTFVSNQLQGTQLNIQLTQVFQDCKDNKAIFQSLNLSQIVNLSQVMDLNNYGIGDTITDVIASVNVDLSGVVIFSNKTRVELNNLMDAGLTNINFTSYITQLDRGLTSLNLSVLAGDLDTAASDIESVKPATAAKLRTEANTLREIDRTTVADMVTYTGKLKDAIPVLMSTITGPPSINDKLTTLITTLHEAQKTIQQNGTLYIKQFIQRTGTEIINRLTDQTQSLAYKIENDLGRCEPVYRSVDNIVHAGCVDVLGPFNGFWFSIGMCLFFLIPIIIVSLCLVSLYRKTEDYYDDKSFDDVNYDAYTGVYPGDNIPLEEYPNMISRPRMY